MPDTEEKDIRQEDVQPSARHTHLWIWLAVLFALTAWALLAWFDGYAAMAVAAAGIITGSIGARRSSPTMKRLAITAIIASSVLLVVVAAYITILKIGLS